MQFGGKYLFEAPRDRVWAALNDTVVLRQAIPGCTRIDWVSATTLEAEVAVNLGLVKPVFSGELELSDVDPAVRYTLSGRGKGGVLGLAHGEADIALADLGEHTQLLFSATGGASGRIMNLGKSLLGKSAQGIIDRFFERFGAAMGATVTPLNDGDNGRPITRA
jgi:uncharacterized protein